jgi:hypothetical protein
MVPALLCAQDALYLNDGKILKGKITSESGTSVTLEMDNEWKEVKREEIKEIKRETPEAQPKQALTRIPQGSQIVNLGLGLGIPLNYVTDSWGNNQSVLGSGAVLSGQYVYHIAPNFGIGVEVAHRTFGEKTFSSYTMSGDMSAILGIIRYVFNPASPVRVYSLLGVGRGQTALLAKRSDGTTAIDSSSGGMAFTADLGVEGDLSGNMLWGVSAGISGSGVDETATRAIFTNFGSVYVFNLMAKIGWKL